MTDTTQPPVRISDNTMLPCPFCGSHARFTPREDVSMIRCGAMPGVCHVAPWAAGGTFAVAQARWNARSRGHVHHEIKEAMTRERALMRQIEALRKRAEAAEARLADVARHTNMTENQNLRQPHLKRMIALAHSAATKEQNP